MKHPVPTPHRLRWLSAIAGSVLLAAALPSMADDEHHQPGHDFGHGTYTHHYNSHYGGGHYGGGHPGGFSPGHNEGNISPHGYGHPSGHSVYSHGYTGHRSYGHSSYGHGGGHRSRTFGFIGH